MGTSSDHSGGSGNDWNKARQSGRNWADSGGGRGPKLVELVANAAAALAGYDAFSATTSASQPLARLGGLAGGPDAPAGETLNAALVRNGLDDLVGRSPSEVHARLVDHIAGDPQDRDADLIRSAADEAVGDLIEGAEDLDNIVIDEATANEMAQRFITGWLTRLMVRELGTVLTDANPQAQSDRVNEIREYIYESVAVVVEAHPVGTIDWSGSDGAVRARQILNEAREVFTQ